MSDRELEAKLGFDRVRKNISDRCSTEYAVRRVEEEEFTSDEGEIRHRLLLTDEMRLIVMFEEQFPSDGYVDCTGFLKTLEKPGSNIDLTSLGKLRTMTDTMRRVLAFFYNIKDGVYPCLKRMVVSIRLFPEVTRRIDGILDKYGNVKDNASVALADIRKSLKEKEGAVSKRMASILKEAQSSGIVDADAGVTVRDGKMLIPVNTAHKRRLPGFVYDESATGKTTFIQPSEIVGLENDIQELHFAETREIFRILSEFSDFARPYVPELLAQAECICELDFIMAKAQTALDYIAGLPVISDCGEMNLRKARHPLLEKALKREGKEMSPLTVTLNPRKHILLISGPNAGGKSVCLKTVGLLQYMFQWGMLIPTSESSEMTVFDRLMVGIGDGQSIDNDLSTYSAFLVEMKEMLAKADARTLVLIDELGSGTDPAAGGAIAEAILGELDKRGVYGVLTTHYSNLKLYASGENSGVVNGAMLFDTARIAPLFKLEIGLPGSSFAFELARKMGLPEGIVKEAEGKAGEEYVAVERNLRKIARNRKALDEKLQKIRTTDKTLENITVKYRKELEGIGQLRKEILNEARREAEEIVKGANRQVENTIRTIKESQAEKEKTAEARKELQDFMTVLTAAKQKEQSERGDYIENKIRKIEAQQGKRAKRSGQNEAEVAEKKRLEAFRNAPLKVGEKVRIKGSDIAGEVSTVSNKVVTIIIGNIRSTLSPDKVERISSNEFKASMKDMAARAPMMAEDPAITERKLNFKPEIDVRGARVTEAMETVMDFVDDAIMLNVSPIRIIHGKGTGVLRIELQKMLKTIPGVVSVSDEQLQLGGTGVTVVTLG